VAPVVRFGGRTAICKASLRTQPIFKHFQILRLNVSMRQRNDPNFASFLDAIGDNHDQETVDLGRLRHTESIQTLIDFVFPPSVAMDPMVCISRAILSPFNSFVDEFNSTILRTVPGQTHTYISSDSIEGDTDGSNNSILADPEFLNSLNEPGIPPHEVILKVGAICRLTRNLNAAQGLTKNTRVIIRHLFRYTVEVETISTILAGRIVEPVSTTRA
jgi:hypothetical protein